MSETEPMFTIDKAAGLRRVLPYNYTYRINAKGRWFSRSLVDVFTEEFKDQPREYYLWAVTKGALTVNSRSVAAEYLIKNGDVICHTTHKHEPPVSDEAIRIVFEDKDLVVVDKPASIPVHPTGRYNHNTITGILKSKEFGYKDVFPVNRLDRLTSGILLLALNKEKASQLSKSFTDRSMQKTYLCRVRGDFPDDSVTCSEPIKVVTNSQGINTVSPDGLPSETEFSKISFDGKTSLVQCQPKTGRMHQIRVHLQFLGFPIANDPLYANEAYWGKDLAKGGGADASEVSKRVKSIKFKRMLAEDKVESSDGKNHEKRFKSDHESASSNPETLESRNHQNGNSNEANALDQDNEDPFPCPWCINPIPDPPEDEKSIFLHAWKYKGDGWEYETEKPAWAK
ncbi:pseudouridine synthase [Chytriomyces cf. hyalinus JEL632]|nr:pseudouridine synthase [Chytriomyces cf. hyalinus JEL632]